MDHKKIIGHLECSRVNWLVPKKREDQKIIIHIKIQ